MHGVSCLPQVTQVRFL
ncbi:unnamed protein product [Knipowitschia caucasica]